MAERVLVVDDDEAMQFTLREALAARGLESVVVASAEAALEHLQAEEFDLVLLDVKLEGMTGMEALPRILRLDPQMPVIMITAHGSREMGLQAIKAGAYDFFEKPFKMDELSVVIRRALERRSLVREVSTLSDQLGTRLRFENIIGSSSAMQAALARISKAIPTDVTILLCGENGTGKGLLAQAIHHNSPRGAGPFVTITCASIPEGLLESELFGHERGAFTDARVAKPGKFELAEGGTVFLDEVGDLSPATQAKLLRVLQDHTCERLGGTKTIKVNVRIIAATNKDLERAVQDGTFREDLYYRINVVSVRVPPLRERKEDVPLLVEHFIRLYSAKLGKQVRGFSAEAMALLLAHDWPGNVRELEHLVEHALVMADGPVMGLDCLPTHIVSYRPRAPEEPTLTPGGSLDDTLESLERKLILSALQRTGGVQSRAARLLGITERSLWHRVKKHGIDIEGIKEHLAEG
mgnify:CR=1 FL=1